jgi:hypothetical protein
MKKKKKTASPQKTGKKKVKFNAKAPLTEKDLYFSDPKVMAHIQEGISDMENGRMEEIKLEDIHELLGL